VSRWAAVFGWENVRVRLLDPYHLLNGNVFDDILAILGVSSLQPPSSRLQQPGKVNVSSGWKVLEAIRGLYSGAHGLPPDHPLLLATSRYGGLLHDGCHRNSLHRRTIKGWQKIGNLAARLGETRGWNDERGHYLTREQAQKCIDLYRQAIVALNAHLETPLPLPLDLEARYFVERDYLPDWSRIPAHELRTFYDELGDFALNGAPLGLRTV